MRGDSVAQVRTRNTTSVSGRMMQIDQIKHDRKKIISSMVMRKAPYTERISVCHLVKTGTTLATWIKMASSYECLISLRRMRTEIHLGTWTKMVSLSEFRIDQGI